MSLFEVICQQLRHQGEMPFVEFMHQALYEPNFGYYSSGLQKFGAQGDFITAPELTSLFGYTLANQCQQVLKLLPEPVLFEFGAGSGRLCVDILTRLEVLNALPKAYYILEVSGNLRLRQQEYIQQRIPHLAPQVKWLSKWPTEPFNGVVIANEVLDAMPVHRFLQTQTELLESYIFLNAQEKLQEKFKPCTNLQLIKHVKTILPAGCYPYQSEANLFIDGWLQQCYSMLNKGIMLLIDYGYPRHEYYHPDRFEGTLMCHYQHRAHTNPLAHPGEEDITAHVDFTHVAEAAHAAGFHVAGFANQASFLLGNGLLSLLEHMENERDRIRAQQDVKVMVQPQEMGELFKVMALSKEVELMLDGFQLQDRRVSL